jgi:hypothetical protein
MRIVTFDDGDLFYRYDKGVAVQSKDLRFGSHQPRASNAYAYWFVQAVGMPAVPSTQAIGVPDYEARDAGLLAYTLARGGDRLALSSWTNVPGVGWELGVREEGRGYCQGLGKVTATILGAGVIWVTFEIASDYNFAAGSFVYFYRPAIVASGNLFIPRRMPVRVEYDYGAGRRPAAVVVHRRDTAAGSPSFFYGTQIAQIGEGETTTLDAGYYAFVACHPLETVAVDVDGTSYTHHYNEPAAPFAVRLEGVRGDGYLLRRGLTVRQAPQAADGYAAPGPATLYRDGVQVAVSDGRPLATRGDIFLAAEGTIPRIAWNDHGFDGPSRTYFPKCKVAVLAGTRARKLFVDRSGSQWFGTPAYEIEGGVAVFRNALYGGRRTLGRNWVRTGLRIVWASPPQDNLPFDYDGGRAAVVMVPGSRPDFFAAGDVIRLGTSATGEPLPKEYVVSETNAGGRVIGLHSPYALDDTWRGVTAVFTWAVVLEVSYGDKTLANQIREEFLGKYISVSRGIETKHEVWRLPL